MGFMDSGLICLQEYERNRMGVYLENDEKLTLRLSYLEASFPSKARPLKPVEII